MKPQSFTCPRIMCAAVVVAFAAQTAFAADIVLAERGREAEYVIVVPASSSPSQRYAAEELRDFTERTTGVTLPIKEFAAGETVPTKAIVLAAGDGKDAALGEDGFRLHVEGGRLLIEGGSGRGTLYGVYEILERFAGCRWYSSWHSKIPALDRITVPGDLDETQKPAVAVRIPYWADVLEHRGFAARLRANSLYSAERGHPQYGGNALRFVRGLGNCHTLARLLPKEKFAKEHPEYFSGSGRQPCLTNPDVLEIVTSNVLEAIRRDPDVKCVGVSQNDSGGYCTCPSCKAVDDEEGSHAGTMIRFVNKVAEAVEREFPNVLVETLAYRYTRRPPKTARPRHNVLVCLCDIECDFSRPLDESTYAANREFLEDMRGWAGQGAGLMLWDYTTDFNHYVAPFQNVYSLQGNLRLFRDWGALAVFSQGGGIHADFAELKAWLISKWMWNPDLPIVPLLDDFFEGYYGEAAPFVREYFDEIHRRQLSFDAPSNYKLGCYAPVTNPAITDEFLEWGAEQWRKAADAVKGRGDEAFAYNVRMGAISVDYMRLERLRPRLKVLNMTRQPYSDAAHLDVPRLAAGMLSAMASAKEKVLLCENSARAGELMKEWCNAVNVGSLPPSPEVGIVEDEAVDCAKRWSWGNYLPDPLAEDGRALKLYCALHGQWVGSFPLDRCIFEGDKGYALRIRVRIDKTKDGYEAFFARLLDKSGKCIAEIKPRTEDVPDGYSWFEVGSFRPAPGMKFVAGPGRWSTNLATGKGITSGITGVWIDKLEFRRIDGGNP